MDKTDECRGLYLCNGIIEQIDRDTAELLGFTREQMTGQPFFRYISPDSHRNVESFLTEKRTGNGIVSCDAAILGSPDNTKTLRMTIASCSSQNDRRFLLILTDITDLVQEKDKLRNTICELNLLIDTTRHDVMNKLSVAYSYNSLLLASVGDPQVITYLDHQSAALHGIERHLRCMHRYRDTRKSRISWLPLFDTICSAMTPFEPSLFRISPENFGYEVFAECLFENVFGNLFENAVRYARGLTRITLTTCETDQGLTIVVSDDGEGVPEPEKERIFITGVGRGTGLGLALSRDILKATGIQIRECGIFGTGAKFEIRIPHGSYHGFGKFLQDRESAVTILSTE